MICRKCGRNWNRLIPTCVECGGEQAFQRPSERWLMRCEKRLRELGSEGRALLHHWSHKMEDWEPELRLYYRVLLDYEIESW
jgi:hypothetical protein